jgi:hypothetical protein
VTVEPPILLAPVDPRIEAELPGLALAWCTAELPTDPSRHSSPALRARLRALSDRWRGADAIVLRSRPIPHAYRVLFRSLGIEPDVDRIPVEGYVVERLRRGAFPSRGTLADALLLACVETGVGVWACDDPRALRLELIDDRVSVASEAGLIARAFSAPPPVSSRVLALYAIVAPGVPFIAVEEALWTAWDVVVNG